MIEISKDSKFDLVDFLFRFYKRYISPLGGQSCRFYPTCSEYSMMYFKFSNPLNATLRTILRILRCNQLFRGGFEYPQVRLKTKDFTPSILLKNHHKTKVVQIRFYFVPIGKSSNKFYVIKGF